jgi:hypothetical protein
VAYLDSDEIDALTISMKTIREKVLPSPIPTSYTESFYRSRCGFEAGCCSDKGEWKPYLQLKLHNHASITLMKKGDFDVFLQILDNVKAKL